ncbi:MAG: polysaccharide biosynthesis protein [Oligoflexia bacterium]|nr:polysaccharide biosynthesis protein [Oligoflexia bacterium]
MEINRLKTTIRGLVNRLQQLRSWQKIVIALGNDFVLSMICFYSSFVIRYGETNFPDLPLNKFLPLLIVASIVQSACFFASGIYKGIWRYSSTYDLIRVIKGVTLAVLATMAALFIKSRLFAVPRTVFFIDWLLLIISIGGSRFAYRMWRDNISLTRISANFDKVIIYGSGDTSEKLLREIKASPHLQMKVVAFIDNDMSTKGRMIHGVPVFAPTSKLSIIADKFEVTKVLIADPSISSKEIRKIIDAAGERLLEYKTLPKFSDFIAGKASITQLKALEPEDLLGREEVILDSTSLSSMASDKTILITGAGGSIGSELCRQIAKFNPHKIIFFEQSEFNMYKLERDMRELYPNLSYHCIMGDVRNEKDLDYAFAKFRPEIVLHAAAYKHVPMMEANPTEAVKTNILGTVNVSNYSLKYNVERFVMISTDKAVNPTNIMGATKRVAESYCQFIQKKTDTTKFLTVRFGNVLGSSGSVIPLFKEQIEKGGPITVTHKDITRYFMSIPEASRLVLQAGALGIGGEVFVLDMGEPIKIVDLAKQMISMSGLKLDEDIKIEYTGLRPGEKLFEELLLSSEETLPTLHPLVKVAKAQGPVEEFTDKLKALLSMNQETNVSEIKNQIKVLVPEYFPNRDEMKVANDVDEKSQKLQ